MHLYEQSPQCIHVYKVYILTALTTKSVALMKSFNKDEISARVFFLMYILKKWILFIANLICYSNLGYQVLIFTSKRIISQTSASYEQNGFSVWYRNKWRSLKNIQGSCSQQYIHVKGDKIRFGRFTGKAFNCQFNLNVSLMKLLKTFYVYKCKYRKSCNTLFSWHVHK